MDVARALGMCHATIYRHFASRTALHDALVDRWLEQVSVPLREIAARPVPAAERLEAALLALIAAKRRKVLRDPELFEAYHAAAEAARTVVDKHVGDMRRLLEGIVRDGVASGEFAVRDVDAAVTAIRDATARFVDPHYIRQMAGSGVRKHEQDATRVLRLVIAGLRSGEV
jgi:AcrR family transcriptional regulator